MREGKLTLVVFLGTLAHALVIEDPQSGQSLPAGFRQPTLKSSLDEPAAGSSTFGFGQMSPFSGSSLGANSFGSFPAGSSPVNSPLSFGGGTGSFTTGNNPLNGLNAFGGNSGGFPTGTGTVGGIPGFNAGPGSFPTGNGPASDLMGFSRSGRGFPFDPSSSGSSTFPLSPSGSNPSFGSFPFSPLSPGLSGRLGPSNPLHGASPLGNRVVMVPVHPSHGHDVHHDTHHHDIPVKHDPHHHDIPVKHDPHHHDIPVKHDPHHHDVTVKHESHHVTVKHDPHHHDVPVKRESHHHRVIVKHDPHHHDIPVKHESHHHRVTVKHDPHHHDVPVNPHDPHLHVNPHAGDVVVDDFYSPKHRIGDLVPIGAPGIHPPRPHNGPECQFSGCSIGQECVIAKTILTKSETLCPRAYSGRCVCVPGCIHDQKFIPSAYLKYEGRCSYCKCHPDGRVECKKSKACFAAKNHRAHSRDIPVGGHHDPHSRDIPVGGHRDPHSRDVPVHREVHRGVLRRGRTFSLGGLINQFLRNLF
ncbi:uncharacterized protein LOC111118292 [Crassostrea virginica]